MKYLIIISIIAHLPIWGSGQSLVPDTVYTGNGQIKYVMYRNAATTTTASTTNLADSVGTLRTLVATKQNSLGFIPYNATNPNNYIGAADTAAMLTNYRNAINTGVAATSLKVNISDTSGMLTAYRNGLNLGVSTKLNKSDTAAMLLAYQNAINAGVVVANTKLATNGNGSQLTNMTSGQVGLGNVTNTSDANKPVSTAQQTALDLKANLTSPTLVTPVIGAATGTSLALTGNLTTSGGSIGYATGNGGVVTQLTNRSTGVTINKISGAITTNNTSLAAAAEATFVVTNSAVAIGDVILVSARSGQTANTSIPFVTAVGNGSFSITLSNFNAATADTGAMIINFIILKSVSN